MDDLTESIADNYDRLAEAYARQLFHELERKPLDRQLLEAFAAETAGRGEVCDMGCGPGQVARYLRDLGAAVFGLDLSPQMVVQAQKLNPDIPFREGNMLALDMGDGVLAGIAAFYAIVNIPLECLQLAFEEMARVLKPGGVLLMAFHVGDEVIRPPELWEVPIAINFFFFQPAVIRTLLENAGFDIEKVVEREPYGPDVEHPSRRAYVFARKPTMKAMAMAPVGSHEGAFFVRKAVFEDGKQIVDCLRAAFAQYRVQYTPKAWADTVLDSDRIGERLNTMCVLVAVSAGKVIGTIGCGVSGTQGHLRGMAVSPENQGSGTAAALLEAAEKELRDRGCTHVTLDTTEPLNRAMRFYQKHGFTPSGRISDFFGMSLYEYKKSL